MLFFHQVIQNQLFKTKVAREHKAFQENSLHCVQDIIEIFLKVFHKEIDEYHSENNFAALTKFRSK